MLAVLDALNAIALSLFALAVVNLLLLAIYLTRRIRGSSAVEELKRRKEELEAKLEAIKKEMAEREKAIREHYEQLLRDASIKNSMMVALWNAYKSGELARCYKSGGTVRVLADGTVICEKGEESYAIGGERAGERGERA